MSNIIYGFNVAYEEEPKKKVIDSNRLSQEFVNQKERELIELRKQEERKRRLEEMKESGAEIPDGMNPEEFQNLSDSIMGIEQEPLISTAEKEKIIEDAKAEAEKIVSTAKTEADFIVGKANSEAESIKQLAAATGHDEGYQSGVKQAETELAQEKQKLDMQLSEMKALYDEKTKEMEKDLMEVCCDVFGRVFMTQLDDCKPVLFHLIDNCLMNIEPSRQFQIRVNDKNCQYIKDRKDEILDRVGSEAVIDVIADPVLSESQCVIETDGGLFDCGIDTQLDELTRRLKMLS